jgi:hypothetical protein
MTRLNILLTLTLMTSASTLDAAGTTMRPGLWEFTSTMKSQSGEMEKAMREMDAQMAAMPPEQRKMMENMMGSQGVRQTSKGTTVRVCVTPEEVKRNTVPAMEHGCTQQIVRKSGNTVWFKYSCKSNPPSSGEGEYTLIGDKAYKGKMKVTTRQNGRAETVEMTQSGKWLSERCKP